VEIELRLAEIRCSKSSETSDELYVQVDGTYADGKDLALTTYPADTVWELTSGQSIGPNQTLFTGQLNQALTLKVRLNEEDGAGYVKVLDDTLGGFSLTLNPDGSHQFEAQKDTEDLGTAHAKRQFRLTGHDADYFIDLELLEKRSLL